MNEADLLDSGDVASIIELTDRTSSLSFVTKFSACIPAETSEIVKETERQALNKEDCNTIMKLNTGRPQAVGVEKEMR